MIEVSEALAAAIEAGQRQPLVRLVVDWDGDGFDATANGDNLSRNVGALTIDRTLIGELPAEVTFVEGSAAASLDADLTAGYPGVEEEHAAHWFSRANTDGLIGWREPLARPVIAEIGFVTAEGPQFVRRFTGRTRALPVSSRRRTARLSALDGRELLRDVVQLPGVFTGAVGLNATWLISNILHTAGVHPSPPPDEDAAVLGWIPGHGSVQPFGPGAHGVVRIPTPGPVRHTFQPGPFVLAPALSWRSIADNDMVRGGWVLSSTRDDGDDGELLGFRRVRLQWWVKADPFGSVPLEPMGVTLTNAEGNPSGDVFLGMGADRRLRYTMTDNHTGEVYAQAFGPALPTDGAWHLVGVEVDAGTDTARFRLDQQTTVVDTDATPYASVYAASGLITAYLPFAETQLTGHQGGTVPPWLNTTPFTPDAVLDRSLLDVDAVTERTAREAWSLLGEIAAAEQAVMFFDENGVFRYRTRTRLTSVEAFTSRRTLTAAGAITDLDATTAIDAVRNIVAVPYTPVMMDPWLDGYTWLWDTRDRHTIPAGGSVDIWVAPDRPIASVDTIAGPITARPNHPVSYLTVSTTPDGSHLVTDGARAKVVEWDVGRFRLTLTNTTGVDLYTANTLNIPAIAVAGVASRVDRAIDVQVRDPDSIAAFGPQPYNAPSNQWVQRRESAQALADALLADLAQPSLVVTNLAIIGDPRLQLGDLVHLVDPDGIALVGDYWITAIRDEIGDTYRQRITARRAPQLLRWGVGVWGSTVWGRQG